jgi:hypothetical protein
MSMIMHHERTGRGSRLRLALGFAAIAVSALGQTPVVVKNQGYLPFADAPINYRSESLNDPIAKLERQLESGAVKLEYAPGHGYLRSVLAALHVPVSSQTLVFSKTSFQYPKISPERPRALYYNDDVYVGQVHNGRLLEFISFDPMQGAIFYVMNEREVEHPRFERSEQDCVQCHVASTTRGVPGVFLRSVYAGPSGTQAGGTPAYITGHESPLNERWGGWFVTGNDGGQSHMGNAVLAEATPPEKLDRAAGASSHDLSGRIDTSAYLTKYSDIVAHLVLAHQTQMHNLITQTNYQTRLALYADETKRKAGKLPPAGSISDAARQQFQKPAEQLVRYLLFTNEAPLEHPVSGTSGFAEEFAARGPRDSKGRSLRDFDLNTRIFKYPCSYLIYSEHFDNLPAPAKDYVYSRMFEILTGREQGSEFSSLSPKDRRAILEILVATKPGIPDEWKKFVEQTPARD